MAPAEPEVGVTASCLMMVKETGPLELPPAPCPEAEPAFASRLLKPPEVGVATEMGTDFTAKICGSKNGNEFRAGITFAMQ